MQPACKEATDRPSPAGVSEAFVVLQVQFSGSGGQRVEHSSQPIYSGYFQIYGVHVPGGLETDTKLSL